MRHVLMILSSARSWTLRDGTHHPTGFWAEEFVTPHRLFRQAGFQVTVATPTGAAAHADELSLSLAMNGHRSEVIADFRAYLAEVRVELDAPASLETLVAEDYDAVFIPGGHGPMEDLAHDPSIGRFLVRRLDDTARILASVCHGPASFLSAVRPDGRWAFAGRTLTAFTNEEEGQAGFAAVAAWLLEDRLREHGATVRTAEPWASHIVSDGNLITGQNPGSADAAAREVIRRIS
jgi:putative intracellular protease/amidase